MASVNESVPVRHFEDIEIGELSVSERYSIGEQEIIDFAEQFDPLPIHTCTQTASESQFGRLIASGVHTLALWRKLDYQLTSNIDAICGLGVDSLRFRAPVFAGDTIWCELEVKRKQKDHTNPGRGIVTFAHKTFNHHDTLVMSHSTRVLVQCR